MLDIVWFASLHNSEGCVGVCGGVWRQSDRVCSRRSRKPAASLPLTLSTSWQRKTIHQVRWCQTFARVALPILHPCNPCKPVVMQSRGLHKNYLILEWLEFIWENWPVNSLLFRDLFLLIYVKWSLRSFEIQKQFSLQVHSLSLHLEGPMLIWIGLFIQAFPEITICLSFSSFFNPQYLIHSDLCQHQISWCFWLFTHGGGT